MSHFLCEHCGKEILEGPDGHYITGCEHYPIEAKLAGPLLTSDHIFEMLGLCSLPQLPRLHKRDKDEREQD